MIINVIHVSVEFIDVINIYSLHLSVLPLVNWELHVLNSLMHLTAIDVEKLM